MPGILGAFCIHMQPYLPSISECFIPHQNNAASSETHFLPWFKGSSFANLWNRVKSCLLISGLAEWESRFTVAMENFHTLIIPHFPKRIKVLMILNQSNHNDQSIYKTRCPLQKKNKKRECADTLLAFVTNAVVTVFIKFQQSNNTFYICQLLKHCDQSVPTLRQSFF